MVNDTSNQSSLFTVRGLELATLIMLVAKLWGVADLSWWVVAAPLATQMVLGFVRHLVGDVVDAIDGQSLLARREPRS